jgi:DNA helicase-2/ATP-dependent DNA helicase PcrA
MPRTKPTDEILDGLNDEQQRAVTHEGSHLLVLAGAGSGKTRVITRRIAWLLQRGVHPSAILAITFTNKAAAEMAARIQRLVSTPPDWMGTFHATCARLLRFHAHRIDRRPDFSIYDRDDSLRVLRQILKELGADDEIPPAAALSVIGEAKNDMRTGDELRGLAWSHERIELLRQTWQRYQARLLASNAMDFDDLLLEALRLLQSVPDVLDRYAGRFRHILVDEYQDTNRPQNELVKLLASGGAAVTAVGDPDQMIYGWRGARIENIMEFAREFPGTRIVKLESNYRSTRRILQAATSLIACNRYRHPKVLRPVRGQGRPVRIVAVANPAEEAEVVSDIARELLAEGLRPRDLAVFYRTNLQSRPFELQFATDDLPYAVLDSTAFYQRKEVKDLRAWLVLIANERDDEAFRRAATEPARGIGARSLEDLARAARARGLSLLQAARIAPELELKTAAVRRFAEFARLLDSLRDEGTDEVAPLLRAVLKATDYVARAARGDEERCRDIANDFVSYARDWDAADLEGRGLQGFLEQLALVSDTDRHNPDRDAVSLLTLHAAKGLEFPVVFITGLEEGLLPHSRSVSDAAGDEDPMRLEEERRLFHVGMTRAQELLVLTCCAQRTLAGRREQMNPSRFLDELPRDAVDLATRPCRPTEPAEPDDETDIHFQTIGRHTPPPKTRRSPLVRRRTPKRPATPPETLSLSPGDVVEHRQLGRGVVRETDTVGGLETALIEFDEVGTQRIILRHSGLRRVRDDP